MTATTAIQTQYAGCLFRSRLEARWAVFFDNLRIEWQYEPQGFYIGEGDDSGRVAYLPDFYLPDSQLWVEVKGELTPDELRRLCLAALDDRGGLPATPDGDPVTDATRNRIRLLILGDIPRLHAHMRYAAPVHTALEFHKGSVFPALFTFDTGGTVNNIAVWGSAGHEALYDDCEGYSDDNLAMACLIANEPDHYSTDTRCPDNVAAAYAAARSARFEHEQRRVW